MNDDGFTKVAPLSRFKDRRGERFLIDDVDVAVYKIDDKFYSISNICPHQHAAIIHNGFIENGSVVCPAHGWEFDIVTGKVKSGVGGLSVYETKIIDGFLFVKVYKKELNW
ncbi:MAG: Rieske (2Fe-2S) protein [Bacteroidota bacterium]